MKGVLIEQKEETTLSDMPFGTIVHHIEITRGRRAQLARAAGATHKLIVKEGKSVILKLSFKEVCLISKHCLTMVGIPGNVRVNQKGLDWANLIVG